MKLTVKEKWPCRVCGLDMGVDAWGGDENLSFTYDICDCCGAEAGVDDFSREVVQRYRREWMKNGCPWFFPSSKPDGWNVEEQFTHIPEKWR